MPHAKNRVVSNSLKFGTSGLRGLSVDLVGPQARRDSAAVVRDTRGGGEKQMLGGRGFCASSREIAAWVISAIRALGVEAIDCGELPPPALALQPAKEKLPAIMVTGSHIPADRNGLK